MLTPADKQIVAGYMGWSFDDDANLYFYTNKELDICIAHYDLNDAGLCVEKMNENGDFWEFWPVACRVANGEEDIFIWLFNADNFFAAMATWLRSKE